MPRVAVEGGAETRRLHFEVCRRCGLQMLLPGGASAAEMLQNMQIQERRDRRPLVVLAMASADFIFARVSALLHLISKKKKINTSTTDEHRVVSSTPPPLLNVTKL